MHKELKERNEQLSFFAYEALITGYTRAGCSFLYFPYLIYEGDLQELQDVWKEMIDKKMVPNERIICSAIKGYFKVRAITRNIFLITL